MILLCVCVIFFVKSTFRSIHCKYDKCIFVCFLREKNSFAIGHFTNYYLYKLLHLPSLDAHSPTQRTLHTRTMVTVFVPLIPTQTDPAGRQASTSPNAGPQAWSPRQDRNAAFSFSLIFHCRHVFQTGRQN